MIWSQKQVFAVERLSQRQMVSREVMDRGTDYFEAVCERMGHDLINYAHPLGVELNMLDLHIGRPEEFSMYDSVMLVMRWAPETRAGLLLGGPADGTRVEMPQAAHRWSFRVVVASGARYPQFVDGPWEPTALEVDTVDYNWSGWHEEERVWTYEPAK